MNIHFEISVPNANVGITILKQIHKLTGILPINVTGYDPARYNEHMKPIADAVYELKSEETTRYSHLRIIRNAV